MKDRIFLVVMLFVAMALSTSIGCHQVPVETVFVLQHPVTVTAHTRDQVIISTWSTMEYELSAGDMIIVTERPHPHE